MYSAGTIKLTWIDPLDYRILNSEMHENVDQAIQSANQKSSLGNNWLIFQLIETENDEYQWKVLPYGKHKGYVNGMKIRDNKILRYGSIALMIYGGYSLSKLLFNQIR
jgi:hypothetical protein